MPALCPLSGKELELVIAEARKNGAAIPPANQCPVCHSGRHYTNLKMFDVGSGKPTDRSPLIDTPQLTNTVLTAPYLHDGSAASLEEMFDPDRPS
jgi:cytochrome c peroxidase